MTWTGPDGVTVDAAAGELALYWQRQGSVANPPFPVKELLARRGFTIDAGTHTRTFRGGASTAVETESAQIEFIPKGKLKITKLDLRSNLRDADCPAPQVCRLQYLSVSDDYNRAKVRSSAATP